MKGQSRFRRVCLLTVAALCLAASDDAAARSAGKGERASHARARGTAAIARAERTRIARSAPHVLVIRRYAPIIRSYPPEDYLCPRPDAPSKQCTIALSLPVELSGPGSSATSLGSSVLQPPQVPPVDYNQPAAPGLFRVFPTIGPFGFATVAGRIPGRFVVAPAQLPAFLIAPIR